MENTKQIRQFTYRIKSMNALEVLALKTCVDFDNYESTLNMYNVLLDKIEVQIIDKWLTVKEKDSNVFCPAEAEHDIDLLQELITFIMEYIQQVFPKSNGSKTKQE